MQEIYLGRQPILDRNHQLVAYELLFRSGESTTAEVKDDFQATADVIVSAFCDLGVQRVLGRHKGFINVNAELLNSDLVELLPKEQIVLELLETMEIDGSIIDRCAELKRKGFKIAVDDVVHWNSRAEALLKVVDIVKIDVLQTEPEALRGVLRATRTQPLLLLAEKVDTREQSAQFMEMGFHLFQGYFFACPQVMSGKRADFSKIALLKLMSLILADAGPSELEEELKRHPSLAYNLMRMVNSAASGLTRKISSLKQGIVILGRRQLQRWVQLLLYTAGRNGPELVSPLMQLAATRGKLMEILAAKERPRDPEYHDRAFMTGILSLLDALLAMPMTHVLGELNLAEEVRRALLSREGRLGQLLKLQEQLEANDLPAISRSLEAIGGLSLKEVVAAQLDAVCWANGIAEPSP